MGKRASVCKFPVARIKKIMQANEEVGKVSAATPVAISKALELFIEHIISESVEEARSKNSKKITAYHLKRAVHHHEAFDFLKDIVSKVPDPAEKESVNEGDNRGGKRRKVSGNADAPSAGESSTLQGALADGGDAAPSLIRGGQSTAPKEEYDEEEGEEDEED